MTRSTIADSVFDAIFKVYANRYDLCLLVNDITPLLHVRLMSASSDRRLVAGVLNSNGMVEVETPKHSMSEGFGNSDASSGQGHARAGRPRTTIGQLPRRVRNLGSCDTSRRPAKAPTGSPEGRRPRQAVPFTKDAQLQPVDTLLEVGDVPAAGDKVHFNSPNVSGTVVLDALLGEGGEGKAYAVEGDRVVQDLRPRALHAAS